MTASRSLRRLLIAVILTVVPGWGHIWLHRTTRGLLLFILFFLALNYAIVFGGVLDRIPDFAVNASLAFAAAIVVFAVVDVVRITIWLDSRAVRARRHALLESAVAHYLRREYAQAEAALRRMLRIDPHDGTALMYLGMVLRATGRRGKAESTFKKVIRDDRSGRWRSDARREIARLRGRAAGLT